MRAEEIEHNKDKVRLESESILDFVVDYLEREMHVGLGLKMPTYLLEYSLDLNKLKEYSESSRKYVLSSEEIKNVVLDVDEKRKIFEGAYENKKENNWYDLCGKILDLLDSDYEECLKILNEKLVQVVVSPVDLEYEDYVEPSWKIINEQRLSITFGELNLEDYEGRTVKLTGYLAYVQNPPVERMNSATWYCNVCGREEKTRIQPTECFTCEKKTRFTLDESSVIKERIQECILTEEYESNPSGFQLNLSVIVKGNDVGKYAPGDHVSLTGKVIGVLVKQKGKEPFYQYLVEVATIFKDEKLVVITEEDLQRIDNFSKQENVLEKLSEMLAPGIIGHEVVKKALILQAAGSEDMERGGLRIRGRIHILLVGDPGTGKSQLLMSTRKLSPKALYNTDASAAGLTAAVDEINGKRVMVAGIMVLADNGIAAIDELEKMNKDDRKAIHPAMEQGEIHKSKAGLHASFKSRASVVAAANPKYSRFSANEGISQQIALEDSLLNRFDLIFIFMEKSGTRDYEKKRAMDILIGGDSSKDDGFLMKYIHHSKNIRPAIPLSIMEKIGEYFSALRSEHKDQFLNTRTLESLQRLTMASARIRLREEADIEDFENARELVDTYLAQFRYDMDAISGITNTVRDCIKFLKTVISKSETIPQEEILDHCETYGFTETTVMKALDEMRREGEIYAPKEGKYRGVGR